MRWQRRPVILVGVSGSAASAAALRWATDEARRRRDRLRVVLIWRPEQRAYYAGRTDPAQASGQHDRAVRTLTETVQAVLGPRPRGATTVEVVEGTAEQELVAESAGADLLVLGSGSGGGPDFRIGPVVRTCLREARCPVVVVSQPGSAALTPGHGQRLPAQESAAIGAHRVQMAAGAVPARRRAG